MISQCNAIKSVYLHDVSQLYDLWKARRLSMQSTHSKEDTETDIKKSKEQPIPNSKKKLADSQHIKILKMDEKDSNQVTSDYYFG